MYYDNVQKHCHDARIRGHQLRIELNHMEAQMKYIKKQMEDMNVRMEESAKSYYKTLESLSSCHKEMHVAESAPIRHQLYRSSVSNSRKMIPVRKVDQNNQDVVRQLISIQQFDGLWTSMDSKTIEPFTGKALTDFQPPINSPMLLTAVIIVILETRFASLPLMWHEVVQKARKRFIDLLDKDNRKLDILLEDIRKQL
jgi:hypothetical protein